MTISVNNVTSKNINQLSCNKKVAFKASSPKTLPNDTVEISTKKNNTKNILTLLGALGTIGIGIAYILKKHQVKNTQNLQKTLQEAFFNKNITEKEAIEIKNRYKELEKISDREEYVKALFEETKKNFGLQENNLVLEFGKIKGAGGGYSPRDHKIIITPDGHRIGLLETMCHELRHVKQMQLAANLKPEYAKEIINKNILKDKCDTISRLYIKNGGSDFSDEMINKLVEQAKDEIVTERFGKLSKGNIPEELQEYAKRCLDSLKNNTKNSNKDIMGYWKSFHEVDARNAGSSVSRYVNENAFNFNWVSEIQVRIQSLFQKFKN